MRAGPVVRTPQPGEHKSVKLLRIYIFRVKLDFAPLFLKKKQGVPLDA